VAARVCGPRRARPARRLHGLRVSYATPVAHPALRFVEASVLKRSFAAVVLALGLSGCGYNDIQSADEATKSAWSEVLNQYQRRAELIPNLVNTVKGYAQQEADVLTRVTEARSRVGQIRVDPSDPASLKQFESAQADMGSALSRLLVVAENYPQLKSDQNFRDLQAQLEGTENRITVARKRYIDSVQSFNVLVRQFPVNLTAMAFGYPVKPQFSVENEREISRAPTVDFGKPAAPAKQ
jgi:LemA protein